VKFFTDLFTHFFNRIHVERGRKMMKETGELKINTREKDGEKRCSTFFLKYFSENVPY
jgi:hypothetical protein